MTILLCTPNDVRSKYVSNNAGYAAGDTSVVLTAIANASEIVQNAIGRKFKSGSRVDLFSIPRMTDGRPFRVWLSGIPAIPLSLSGKFSATRLWDETPLMAADTLEVIDADRGIVDVTFWNDRPATNGLRLEYTAGYSVKSDATLPTGYELLDVPHAVAQATAIQAAFDLDRTLSNSLGSDDSGGNQQGRAVQASIYGLVPDAWKLVAGYRRPVYRGV